MKRFLIRVGHQGESPDSTFKISPDVTWRSDTGQLQAWIWGEQTSVYNTENLNFSISHVPDVTGTACPYVNVRLDRLGHGIIKQDPLGLYPLYVGTDRDTAFISNDPHRIADALSAATGTVVPKCLSLSAYLVSCDRPIGFKTGFEGIHFTPYATRLEIDPDQGVQYVPQSPPWSPEWDVLGNEEVDSIIEHCAADMTENLRSWVERAQRKPVLLLTGGLDSRLVLALAIEAGVLPAVKLRTSGDIQHPDVQIAVELTKRLQVSHSFGLKEPIVGQALRDHVQRTAGAINLRSGSKPKGRDGSLVLHGLLGETFRSNVRSQGPIQNREQLIAFWLRPQAQSGLLHREAQITALTEGLDLLLAPVEKGIRPELALDIFYTQHQARCWISTRPEMFANTALPLYSPTAVHLAMKMGWAARRSGFLHETVIGRVGGALSDVPYAADKQTRPVPTLAQLGIETGKCRELNPEAIVTLWYDSTLVHRRPRKRTAESVLSSEREEQISALQAEYREYVEETPRSSIWDVLDRNKVRESIHHLPTLRVRARQELDAAITGILWHST